MLEIERKYLVRENPAWRDQILQSEVLRQGYFQQSVTGETIRVRISDENAYLTIKSRPKAGSITRHEFEFEIPMDQAQEMLEIFCKDRIIEKTRHHLACCGSHWIIDEFTGRHEGLLMAEIELETENESFDKPEWLEEEVTKRVEYTNSYLAENGIPKG